MTILPPKDFGTRPITDRVKESVFDVLYKYNLVQDNYIADLFCGTGSFGLEAVSRGAKFCLFVEISGGVIAILEKNIEKAGFAGQSKVVRADAFKIGAPAIDCSAGYSLIFVDPPYAQSRDLDETSLSGKLLTILPKQLADNGIVVFRTESHCVPLEEYGSLKLIDRRKWGSMLVSFYGKKL